LLPVSLLAATSPAFATGGAWGGGDGSTPGLAYIIEDAADLAELAAEVNAGNSYVDIYFKLGADIDLTAYGSNHDSGGGWIPIGNSSKPFSGHFDGDGHIIENLYINRLGTSYQGLFGSIYP
jgi:hypothetical protein